jgi:linoleoyl-CoA desaturase
MRGAGAKQRPAERFLPPLNFGEDKAFEIELHWRVDEYFSKAGVPRTATTGVYFKAFFMFAVFVATYVLLVFTAKTFWQGVVLSAFLGFCMVGIGVNIQHDGSHNAYSRHRWINRIMAMTVDLIGASSYLWSWKHNRIHHSYTNIAHYDTDIDLGILGRIAPSEKRLWFHRWQHIYLWLFYGLLVIKWQLFDDFFNAFRGKLGNHTIPRPKGTDLAVLALGKLVFFSLAFAIPLFFHSLTQVLFYYALAMIVEGSTLSLIFILPHGVGDAEFPMPVPVAGNKSALPYSRAEHQARVTVDFKRKNPIVTWLVGGLNFHREHHLFPSVSHVHYPRIAGIVDEVCEQFNIPHVNHRSYAVGLSAHYRWLRRMGRDDGSENARNDAELVEK